MKTFWWSGAVLSALCLPVVAGAQTPVGALAIDEGQGERYGWAVDFESASAARSAALTECGAGCAVVLTFERCGAYAADQDAGSTAYGWGESDAAAGEARSRAVSECRARGGTDCIVRAWGCNGPVVEAALGLAHAARREIQLGLRAEGYDPGGADGLFGPRTRAAIRSWQTSRGTRSTGYLDGASAELLRTAGASDASPPAVAAAPRRPAAGAAQPAAPGGAAASPPASAEFEIVFWQSIANSTDPADFEAYLVQFPNGVFRVLAQNRLATLRPATANPAAPGGTRIGAVGAPAPGRPGAGGVGAFSGGAANGLAGVRGNAAAIDARRQPGEVFRDCADCPEMVVVPAGRFRMGCVSGQDCGDDELPVHDVQVGSFALSKYEVLFEEYDRFADATGRARPRDGPLYGEGWGRGGRPAINVSWEDATAYTEWLSAQTGATYRLPSEAEWEYAARAGTTTPYSWGSDIGQNRANCSGCGSRWDLEQTAPAGSFAPNAWGLHDMHGNVSEWVADCWHDRYARAPSDGSAWTRGGDCGLRVLRGGSWVYGAGDLRAASRRLRTAGFRNADFGFRLSRTLSP